MVQKVALFNLKGKVGKTTTTFNLGWMLASKGKRVILVDADPQCNLTEMAWGETEDDEASIDNTTPNIKTGLAPAFESQPRAIEAVDCIPVQGRDWLFLLPGHVGFAEYEVTLGIAQELKSIICHAERSDSAGKHLKNIRQVKVLKPTARYANATLRESFANTSFRSE
jgi:cellulose biosynthesis protein BcsQ